MWGTFNVARHLLPARLVAVMMGVEGWSEPAGFRKCQGGSCSNRCGASTRLSACRCERARCR